MGVFIPNDRTTLSEGFEQNTSQNNGEPTTESQTSKQADLAGPDIGDYAELERILPRDYNPLLTPKETRKASFHFDHHQL
jgi:hypothetical protein